MEAIRAEQLEPELKLRAQLATSIGLFLISGQYSLQVADLNLAHLVFGSGLFLLLLLTHHRPAARLFLADATLWLLATANYADLAYQIESGWAALIAVFCLWFANGSRLRWVFYRSAAEICPALEKR